MALYAADGSVNVTVVDGSTWTGLYADDGSWNVVLAPNPIVDWVGLFNPCGAYNVTVNESTDPDDFGRWAADGSLYVTETGVKNGAQRVTSVSGDLTP